MEIDPGEMVALIIIAVSVAAIAVAVICSLLNMHHAKARVQETTSDQSGFIRNETVICLALALVCGCFMLLNYHKRNVTIKPDQKRIGTAAEQSVARYQEQAERLTKQLQQFRQPQ